MERAPPIECGLSGMHRMWINAHTPGSLLMPCGREGGCRVEF